MARFKGLASVRRALSMPDGGTSLEIKPNGFNWQWAQVPPDRARHALAIALVAIDGRWKMHVSLPDDPSSNLLEIVGLAKTHQPEPLVLYMGIGIGGYNLLSPSDRGFAFDYDHSGKLDHLVFYRPGTGTIWILKNANGTFEPLPASTGDPGIGIGGYDLLLPEDRAFAFDYNSAGKLDHLVLYRPGHGNFWILRNNAGRFQPVYGNDTGDTGIGGYDLLLPEDRAFAFDYDNVGKLDHLVLYRPGHGNFWIFRKSGAGTFTDVVASDTGIRGYDLADPGDRAFAFDYNSIGSQENLVLYRPGTGRIWIMNSLSF